jgi:Ca2+-binding EF-hand superfamily protein
MKLSKSIPLGVCAALCLGVGSAYADNKAKEADPGFIALDTNKNGYLSRKEAAANPELAKKFKLADKNHDGRLSRSEYLWAMTKKDAGTAKNKVTSAGREVKEELKEHSTPTTPQAPASPK